MHIFRPVLPIGSWSISAYGPIIRDDSVNGMPSWSRSRSTAESWRYVAKQLDKSGSITNYRSVDTCLVEGDRANAQLSTSFINWFLKHIGCLPLYQSIKQDDSSYGRVTASSTIMDSELMYRGVFERYFAKLLDKLGDYNWSICPYMFGGRWPGKCTWLQTYIFLKFSHLMDIRLSELF